jgi:GNAT superfamily N-acetyltransferase
VITVRLATLQDTTAITEIHKSDVARWETVGARGELVPVDYDALSLYERWQHGGAWMSIETCAVHLNRLLAGAGFPLVAELDGRVLAEAEVYESFEPSPYGHSLDLSVIVTHADYRGRGLGTALINYIREMARLMKCERITVSHAEAKDFYKKVGFRHTRSGRGVRIPAAAGRAIYQAVELTDPNPNQVRNWHVVLGRYRSSRQEWERLFPQTWTAGIPELLNIGAAHVKITVAGQHAIVFVREPSEPESRPGDGSITCWSQRPLQGQQGQLLTALKDWAHRGGYRALITYALDQDVELLGADVEQTGYTQEFYEMGV